MFRFSFLLSLAVVFQQSSPSVASIGNRRGSIKDGALTFTSSTIMSNTNKEAKRHLRPVSPTPVMVSDAPEDRNLVSCSTGEMYVEIDLVTDQYPQQTSWELYDPSGKTIKSWKFGEYGFTDMNPNDAWLETVGCIAEDACYTLAIFDSAGNGLVSDDPQYYNGSYRVYVNADAMYSTGIVVESGDVAFGSSIYHTFGKCLDEGAEEGGQKNEVCSEGTSPITLDFVLNDDDGDDVMLYLVDLDAEEIHWNDSYLSGNATEYNYFACLDSNHCANLVFPKGRPSDVKVTYSGKSRFVPFQKRSGTVMSFNC
jgi:hypothetical protein